MIKKYESVFVFDGLLSEEEIKALQERVKTTISRGGAELTRMDDWGKRRLAYQIRNRREGYYSLFYFSAESSGDVLEELGRLGKLEEKVLRHLICYEVKSQFAATAIGKKDEAAEAMSSETSKEKTESEKPEEESKTPEQKPAEPEPEEKKPETSETESAKPETPETESAKPETAEPASPEAAPSEESASEKEEKPEEEKKPSEAAGENEEPEKKETKSE